MSKLFGRKDYSVLFNNYEELDDKSINEDYEEVAENIEADSLIKEEKSMSDTMQLTSPILEAEMAANVEKIDATEMEADKIDAEEINVEKNRRYR